MESRSGALSSSFAADRRDDKGRPEVDRPFYFPQWRPPGDTEAAGKNDTNMNATAFPLPLKIENLADGSEYEFKLLSQFVFRWQGTEKRATRAAWDHTITVYQPDGTVTPGTYQEQPARDLVVPAGFCTDFASIPRPLQGFLDAVNDVAPAAVVHDFLYTSQMFESRAMADRIFFDALRANGVGWMRARTLWAGVRLGGWIKWGKNPEEASDWFIRGAEAADAWELSK